MRAAQEARVATGMPGPANDGRQMTDRERQSPRVTPAGAEREGARQDRLARALRENLMKRKAQSRARETTGDAAPPKPDPEG